MYHFAHPAYCPECRASRTGQPRCERCGLLLVGPDADRLYALLAEADAELERLRAMSDRPTAEPAAEQVSTPLPSSTAPVRLTTGSVLLALGALLLVVAAVVFVAVTWGSLSQAVRTMLLVGVTTAFAAAAFACLWRRLRASTEALWSVTAALLVLDQLAAAEVGLVGLDRLGGRGQLVVTAMLLAVPSAVAGVAARRLWAGAGESARNVLVVAELAVVGGAVAAVGALGMDWGPDLGWLPIACLALLVAAMLSAGLLGLRLSAMCIAAAAAVTYVLAVFVAVVELVNEPSVGELVAGSAWPAVLLLFVTVAVAVRGPAAVQAPAAFVASGLVAALCVVPAEQAGPTQFTLVGCAVVVVLALAGTAGLGARIDGVRAAAGVGAVVLVGALAARALRVDRVLVDAAVPVWAQDWDTRLRGVAAEAGDHTWFALALGAALAAVASTMRRWPPVVDLGGRRVLAREALVGAAALSLVGGALVTLLWLATPVWVVGAAAVLAAGVAVASPRVVVVVPAAVTLLVGVVATTGSPGLSAAVLAAAAAALLAQAARRRLDPASVLLAAAGAVLLDVAALAATSGISVTGDTAALVVVLVGTLVATVVTTAVGGAGTAAGRDISLPLLGVEIAAGLGLVMAVSLATGIGPGTSAVTLTVLGAAVVVVGLVRADRQQARWLGLALLQAAWTVRLLDTEVDVVEVYTLPIALVLLALGLWTLLADASASTWRALLPGVALAVLPSLPQALVELTSLRGWLVGAGALVLLGVGIGWRWGAPLAVGGASVALLALAHLVSLATAVPRWVVLAIVGAALLGAGITWEARVRDARALASYAVDLR